MNLGDFETKYLLHNLGNAEDTGESICIGLCDIPVSLLNSLALSSIFSQEMFTCHHCGKQLRSLAGMKYHVMANHNSL